MTIKRWKELNNYLLSISESGNEIGEDNHCYRIDDGNYVREEEYENAFKNDLEKLQWQVISNLQTVEGLSLKDAKTKVNKMSRKELEIKAVVLAMDENACVYYTTGWDS